MSRARPSESHALCFMWNRELSRQYGPFRIGRERGFASGGVPRETGSFYSWSRHVSRETLVERALKTTTSAYVPRGTVRALAFIC